MGIRFQKGDMGFVLAGFPSVLIEENVFVLDLPLKHLVVER